MLKSAVIGVGSIFFNLNGKLLQLEGISLVLKQLAFPNPTTGNITVNLEGLYSNQNYYFTVYNSFGIKVFEENCSND